MGLSREGGIEDGLVFEHRAGDAEQAVGDAAKRTSVAVAAGTQRGVFRLADGVVLYRDPGPVVDGVLEPVVGCETSYDDQRLAGPLGHGSDAGQASQGLIVSPPRYALRRSQWPASTAAMKVEEMAKQRLHPETAEAS